MADLPEFLLARLDAEQAWVDEGRGSPHYDAERGAVRHLGDCTVSVADEIQTKRRVIARHHRTASDHWSPGACDGCGWYGPTDHPVTPPDEACPELADLAFAYNDHPDYRQEWKPAEVDHA